MGLKLKKKNSLFDSSEEEYNFSEIYSQSVMYQGGICSEGVDVPQCYRLNRTLNALKTGIFSFRADCLFCSISISAFYTVMWVEDQPVPCQTRLSVRYDVCGPQSTATVAYLTGIPALGGTRFQMTLCP